MNVEIRTEAAQFLFGEYINRMFFAVQASRFSNPSARSWQRWGGLWWASALSSRGFFFFFQMGLSAFFQCIALLLSAVLEIVAGPLLWQNFFYTIYQFTYSMIVSFFLLHKLSIWFTCRILGPGTHPTQTIKIKKIMRIFDKEQYQFQVGYIICAIHILLKDRIE